MELGVVTENESKMLSQFREKIQDMDIPDELLEDKSLVRWLRAREHRLVDAEIMLRAHMKWRLDINIETLKDYQLPSEWDEYYHCSLYSITPDGFPVFVIKIRTWDYEKAVKAGMNDEITRFAIAVLERGWLTCVDNSRDKKYISQFISLYDLSGLSLSHISSSAAVRIVLDILRGFEANYPECLGIAFMLNAPWIFQVMWKIITPVMSAKTTAKIKFLGSDVNAWRSEISKVVPLDKFPQSFGGDGGNAAFITNRM